MCPEAGAGADAWEEFIQAQNAHELRGLFNIATALFRQATLAFDAGAYPGTSLLCRSALEAALFMFLTREQRDQPKGAWYVVPPETLAGDTRTVYFRELLRAIRKGEILSPEGLKNVERIREHGNVVAHLGARADGVMSGYRESEGDAPLWITEEEALRDLHDTAKILKRLARIVKEEPDRVGPQPRKRIKRVQTWIRVSGKKEGKPEGGGEVRIPPND